MRTKHFCQLIERAMLEQYGKRGACEFDTVPYLEDDEEEPKNCLGIFLNDIVHMGVVSAKAVQLLVAESRADPDLQDATDLDELMADFVDIMGNMRIAPYMQWHCAYFPGLTQDQVLANCESTEDPEEALDLGTSGREVHLTPRDLAP